MLALVTGAKGRLAPHIIKAFEPHYEVVGISKDQWDLRNREQIKDVLAHADPDVIIHTAAITDVDYCESNVFQAVLANRDMPITIAGLMHPKCKFVQISTDMVYPDTDGPHNEENTGPVNIYGRSKLAGERGVSLVTDNHLILRTNFFGPSGSSKPTFSDWALQSLKEGCVVTFYNDVWWTPLHVETLSAVILELVEKDITGTYNLGSRDGLTKANTVGLVAARKLGPTVLETGPSRYQVPRPHDMRMDVSKIEDVLGRQMPTLVEEVNKL